MKKIFKFLLIFTFIIGFSNLYAQKDLGGINLVIKTGNFNDFYGPGDYEYDYFDDNFNDLYDSKAYLNLFYEIEVAENITVSPSIGADIGFDWFMVGARADYYFDSLIPNLPEELDLWGGADSGFILGLDGDKFMVNAHAGGEWRFSENWGALVEGGFGTIGSSVGGGIAYHF